MLLRRASDSLLKQILYLLLITLGAIPLVKAQSGNCPEKFRAYTSKGREVTTFCVGEKIRFASCVATTQPDKEYYDTDKSNGLAFPDTVKSVVYTAPGTYTVTQLINTGLPGNNQFERTFTVLPTPKPAFQAFACAQNQVNLKITDTNYDVYQINFGDGTERRILPGKDTTYRYRSAGPYTLTLKASYRHASCIIENTLVLNSLPVARAPELQNLTITNYSIGQGILSLQVANLQPAYTYILERAPAGSSSFQEIKRFLPPFSTNNLTVNQLDTRTLYQYRLHVTDGCQTKTNVFSNILSTQQVQVSSENKSLRLTWRPYPQPAEVIHYQIYRDGTLLQTIPATATTFRDEAVACGRQYCYRLAAVLANNRSSLSNDTCRQVTATIPPRPGYLQASYNSQNQVELRLVPALNETLKAVNWQKSNPNGAFTNLATDNQPTYLDSAVFSENNSPCYQAVYTDSCGLTSGASAPSCPVVLKGAFNTKEASVALTWSKYVGFTAPPQYTVEVLDHTTGQLLNAYQAGSNTSFRDIQLSNTSQVLAYRIKVTSSNADEISYSNQIRIVQDFSAFLPTAFSPNNDGLNDVFEVKGRFINTSHLKIYNRWGQVIFESKSPNQGWDGKVNGQAAPVGTYVFSIVVQDLNGNRITRTGSVTLVK